MCVRVSVSVYKLRARFHVGLVSIMLQIPDTSLKDNKRFCVLGNHRGVFWRFAGVLIISF